MTARPDNRAKLARRQAFLGLASAPIALLPFPAHAQQALQHAPQHARLRATAAQTLGPFYPRSAAERPPQTDNDLLTVDGERVLSRGTPLYLAGSVRDRRGRPVADAHIEIWQCDANAIYHHPDGGAESERDRYFQGYGAAPTDSAGVFHFRTIRPVPYPGRTAHIHLRVQAAGRPALGTQLYLAGAAGNEHDFLLRQLDEDERRALMLTLRKTESQHPLARATQFEAHVALVLT